MREGAAISWTLFFISSQIFIEVVQVFSDSALGAVFRGGPQDHPELIRYFETSGEFFHSLPPVPVFNFPGNPALILSGHQYYIPPGQRYIRSEERPLGPSSSLIT